MRECVVSRREVKKDHETVFEVTTTTRTRSTNTKAQDQKVVKESSSKKTDIQEEIRDTDVETWYVFYSDKHQREYYFEPKSGTTQWYMPQIIYPSSSEERRSGSQQDASTVNLTNAKQENQVKEQRSRTIQFHSKTLETRGSRVQIMRKLKVSKNIGILFMIFCIQVVLIVLIMIQVRKQRGLNNIPTKDNSSASIIIQSQNNITNINTTSFVNSTFSSTTTTRNLYTSNNSTEDTNNRISPPVTNNEYPTEIGLGQDSLDTSEMGIINTMDHTGMSLFPSEDGEITTSQTIELSSSSTISVSKTESYVSKSSATNTQLTSVIIATKTYIPNNNKDKRLPGQANEILGEGCLNINNNKEKDKTRKKTYNQVIKRRWNYCDLPFLYIFQRCRRFHSREPTLFDLSEIIQSMMQ